MAYASCITQHALQHNWFPGLTLPQTWLHAWCIIPRSTTSSQVRARAQFGHVLLDRIVFTCVPAMFSGQLGLVSEHQELVSEHWSIEDSCRSIEARVGASSARVGALCDTCLYKPAPLTLPTRLCLHVHPISTHKAVPTPTPDPATPHNDTFAADAAGSYQETYQASSQPPAPSYPAPSYPAPSYPAPSYPVPSYPQRPEHLVTPG